MENSNVGKNPYAVANATRIYSGWLPGATATATIANPMTVANSMYYIPRGQVLASSFYVVDRGNLKMLIKEAVTDMIAEMQGEGG